MKSGCRNESCLAIEILEATGGTVFEEMDGEARTLRVNLPEYEMAIYDTEGVVSAVKAHVSTTASAALFDVRTGFVYGVAESTVVEQQRATMWSSEDAIENARLKTEAESFQKLIGEFEKLWKGVVEDNGRKSNG